MNICDLNQKKSKLTRAYSLSTEYLRIKNGFVNEDEQISTSEYFLKWIEYQFLPHYFGYVPAWRTFLRKYQGKRTLPDFCVVGPIKSGSSDLAVNIMMHPNVITPLAKELFSSDLENWRIYYPSEREKQSLIIRNGMALNPFLAPYLHWMELIYNLSIKCPQAKIVLVLRDPIKRFYSQWKWEIFVTGKKRSENLPFLNSFSSYVDTALSAFPNSPMFSACGFDPLQTSIYWKAVEFWVKCFGKNNVLVLDVQDYFNNGDDFLNEVYDFVGLPSFENPKFKDKVNENPIILPPPDEESINKLSLFFDPHNKKLWEILGKEFIWG